MSVDRRSFLSHSPLLDHPHQQGGYFDMVSDDFSGGAEVK